MKQLLQNLRDGQTSVTEVPIPRPRAGSALVRTAASLVSAGTERTLVEFAEKNLVGKARSRPDLVRQVLDKARREGILPTVQAAFNRLDQPMPLGYSSAGTIVEVGAGLVGFQPGDRVACAGGGFAAHAEYDVVPQNLMVKLPDTVDFEPAAFTTLGAIALQGFRLAKLQVGEQVAVIGLGLLGLLTVGIAQTAGCRVFGVDLDPKRIELASKMGAEAVGREDAEASGRSFSRGRGFDAVLICADTQSNDPIELAGILARDLGVVVAVGAVGLAIPRKIYYEKELEVIISRSYGPGRYDPAYEEGGQDYPFGYVRWTEGRNMEAIVEMMASGKLDVQPLITHRFAIEQAGAAYELITGKTAEPFLGVLLTYAPGESVEGSRQVQVTPPTALRAETGEPGLGVLGAGNYAGATFLPVVAKVGGVRKVSIASGAGLTARNAAARFGFESAGSVEDAVFDDETVRIIAVLTRHDQHARQVVRGLQAGKHVFCEKPLAIDEAGLAAVEEALESAPGLLTVGFNRRFAPLAQALKAKLSGLGEPMVAHYRVNAGYLPLTHWLHDPEIGGGRIIGEGCHFVDLLSYLAGAAPVAVRAHALPDVGRYRQDNITLTLTFPDGSLGTVEYLANGDKSVPKERLEVFCAGGVGVLDDFRRLEWVREGKRERTQSRLGQDKGHSGLWEAFLRAVKNGEPAPIAYEDLFGVTRATFAAMRSLSEGKEIIVE